MRKRLGMLIAILLFVGATFGTFMTTALAASVSVSASDSSVEVGDTVTVSIRVSHDNIGGAEGKFSYDSSVLQVTGTGSGAATNGNIALFASAEGTNSLSTSVTFKAKAEGSAKVSVSFSTIIDWTTASVGGASGSASIKVGSEATPTATATSKPTATATAKPTTTKTPGPTEEPTPSPSPTPGLDETGTAVEIAGANKYIWPSLATLTLPDGYTDGKVTFNGEELAAAVPKDGSPFNLVYASDAEGKNGEFYLVLESAIVPFLQLTPQPMTYTIIELTDPTLMPEGFAATTITVDEKEYPALASADGGVTLVYALDVAGTPGLYAFNTELEFMERYYVEPTPVPEPSPEPSPIPTPEPTAQPTVEPASLPQPTELGFMGTIMSNTAVTATLISMAALVIALVVVVIVLAAKKRQPQATYQPRHNGNNSVSSTAGAHRRGQMQEEQTEELENEEFVEELVDEEQLPHVDNEETFVHIDED